MRFPDPSTLGRGFPLVGLPPEASLPLIPPHHFPPNPLLHQPAPLPANLQPSEFLFIPPYDPTQPETPSQYARRFDDVMYGDAPSRISDETTRFVLNNPNGVSRDGQYDHLTEYLMELLEIGVDVIQLPEANVDWRHPNEFKKCRKAITSVFKHAKLSTSSSTKRSVHAKQPGGTLTIGVDDFTGRIYETGRDEQFGRWSYFKASGRNQRAIVIITVYQVCNQPVESAGLSTACKQQHVILDEQHRLSTSATGKIFPHPRQALIQDLTTQLREWQTEGLEIILSGDLNEVLGADPTEFASITTTFKLTDVYRHRHGLDEPATYQRGHRRLDYILCTSSLLPAITACGILPFKLLSESDHRTVYVDFDTHLLFGSLPSELASPKQQPFHSRDYANSEVYINTVHAYCEDHDLYQRSEAALTSSSPSELNKLDAAVGRAMQAGIKAVTKRYRTPFTPAMRQARLSRHYYNLHMQQYKTGQSRLRALDKIQKKLDSPLPAPLDQRECHIFLKDAQQKLRKLRQTARANRQDFLTRRVDFECSGDNQQAAKIRARILKAEDLKSVCLKIRSIVAPTQSAGLTSVLIPVDHPDPKQATVWRKIDDPREVVSLIQARNRNHFGQASNTPFTTGEFHSIPFDGTGELADSILAGQYTSEDPVVQLLLDELVRPANHDIPPIADLLAAVSARFKKWKESTSVSPFSQRYLTQYISLIRAMREPAHGAPAPHLPPQAQALAATAKSLLSLHVRLLELSVKHKHSYSRWQKVANLMLEKDFGIPKIHRLRIIHLYEADLNLLLGIYFARTLVSHIEEHNGFNIGCYGNRPGLSAHEPVLVEELQNSISYLSRTNQIGTDFDATACYDRIPPNLANLTSRSNGMTEKMCIVHGATLDNMSYSLLTALGLSDHQYSNTPVSRVYGTGQGSTYSPPGWGQIVSKLFDAHGKRANGATFQSPDGNHRLFLHMLGFVDDTKNHVNDMMEPEASSVSCLVDRMAEDSQLWSDLLHTAGGALEFPKLYCYVSYWKFEPSGRPFLDDTIAITIPIASPSRTTTVHVPNKSVYTARRTLGPIKCPGRNQEAQYQSLLKKSDDFASVIQTTFLSKREAWTAYFSFYLPMMSYILNTSFLTEKQLASVQKKATQIMIRKCGFNQCTANAVKFGPPSLGAIGFRVLYTEQAMLQQCMLVKHLRTPGQPQKLYLICLSWAQLLSGIGLPLLEFPDLLAPTLEDAFLQSIRQGMIHTGSSLRLHLSLVRPLARENDFYLMEGLLSLDQLSPSQILQVNYCRLYAGAYLASDIITADGTKVDMAFFRGQKTRRPNQPSIKYPRQTRPNADSWKQWRRAIRLLFTAPRSTDLVLLDPLGTWFPLRYDSQLWKFYRSSNSLIVRSSRGLHEFPARTVNRRKTSFPKSLGRPLQALPDDSVPVDPPSQDRRQWQLPVASGVDAVAPTPPSPSPITFSDRIAALDPSLRSLLDNVVLLVSLPELFTLLSSSSLLTLVGDGGAKTSRGSYGAVAAIDERRILTVQGPAAGPDPRSYRAEAYAMAALVLAVVLLLDSFSLPRPCTFAIHLFSDNQGLVNRIMKMQHWKTLYPSTALLPEYDLLSVILKYIHQLPSVPKVQHVKGHQDDDAPVCTLPLPAQLNCEADALATTALESIPAPIPLVPVFPSAVCQLDIRAATTTRRYPSSLRWSAATPDMEEYLKERNQWDQTQFESICWTAFSSARNTSVSPRFVPKYCHRHLPVGVKAHRNDPKYSPTCPACGDPLETNEHFLMCKAPSRLAWRQQFITALDKELRRLHTGENLITFLKTVFERLFEGRIIPQHTQFSDIMTSQAAIGWMPIFRGYWSHAWLTAHKHLVLISPVFNVPDQQSRAKHQDQWLGKVASFVMRQVHQLWMLRNNERHGVTPAEKETRLRITVERELDQVYASRDFCEQCHQAIFYADIAQHKQQPLLELRNWLSMYTVLVKISCKRRQEAELLLAVT